METGQTVTPKDNWVTVSGGPPSDWITVSGGPTFELPPMPKPRLEMKPMGIVAPIQSAIKEGIGTIGHEMATAAKAFQPSPSAITPVERGEALYRRGVLLPPEGPAKKIAEISPSETFLPMGQAMRELRGELGPLEEKLIPPEHWVARGLLGTIASAGQVTGNVVEGMATPTNIALIGGLMTAPQIAGPIIARTLHGALTVSMAAGAAESIGRAAEAYHKGDYVTAGEELVGSGIDALFAYGAGKGATAKAPEGYLRDAWTRFYTKIGGMDSKEAARAAEIAVQKQAELPTEVHQEEMRRAADDLKKRMLITGPAPAPAAPAAPPQPMAPTVLPAAPQREEGQPPPVVVPAAQPFPGAPKRLETIAPLLPTEPLIQGIPKLSRVGTGGLARSISRLETELTRAALERGESPRAFLNGLRAEMDRQKFTPEQYQQYLRAGPEMPPPPAPPAQERAGSPSQGAAVRPEPIVQAPATIQARPEPEWVTVSGRPKEPLPSGLPVAAPPVEAPSEPLPPALLAEKRLKKPKSALAKFFEEQAERRDILDEFVEGKPITFVDADGEIHDATFKGIEEHGDDLFTGESKNLAVIEENGKEERYGIEFLFERMAKPLHEQIRDAMDLLATRLRIASSGEYADPEMAEEARRKIERLKKALIEVQAAPVVGPTSERGLVSGLAERTPQVEQASVAEALKPEHLAPEGVPRTLPSDLELSKAIGDVLSFLDYAEPSDFTAGNYHIPVERLREVFTRLTGQGPALGRATSPSKAVAPQEAETSSRIVEMPVGKIAVDPQRFQFKQGVGSEGVGTGRLQGKQYRPELAGVVSVWTDPADGKTYVVNGHHRLEFAKRSGVERMNVMPLQAANAEEARSLGALQNIAEGRGTALDAAKFFRDSGIQAGELAEQGISLGEATAQNGLALSRLDPFLFDLVVRGDVSQGRGIAIGEATTAPEQQQAILRLIEKAENRGRRVPDDVVRELARFVGSAGERTEQVQTLFGSEARTESLALEKAEVSAYVKRQIQQEKRLFGAVSGQARAEQLGKAGNVIRADENARIAGQAAQAEELYEKLSAYRGPISDILDQASERLAKGESPNAVKDEAYSAIRRELSQAFGGTETAPAPAGEAVPEGQRTSEAPAPSLFGETELAAKLQKHLIPTEKPTLYFMGFDPTEMGRSVRALGSLIKGEGPENLGVGTIEKGIIREKTGEAARAKEQLFHDLKPLIDAADKFTPEESLDFIDRMEAGRSQINGPSQDIASLLRRLLDNRREAVQNLGTGKLENFIENYFPHIWENPTRASDVFKKILGAKRPLQGRPSFLMKRTIPTIAEGIAAGLTPVTYNPATLTLLKVAEMDRYIMAHKILGTMKESGLAKFVRFGSEKPEGWVPLDDRMFRVLQYSEAEKGFVIRGSYYAPPDAAQPLNRYTAPGLRGSPTYQGLRAYGNTLNQFQLGMSAFHLAFTSLDATTSDLAVALQRASRGELGRAIAPAVRAVTLTSPVLNYLKGNRLLKEYLEPGSYADMTKTAELLARAGGRAFMDPFYKNSSIRAFQRSWQAAKYGARTGEYGKAMGEGSRTVLRSFSALAELFSKPIMENIVPRQKLGVFANLAEDVARLYGDQSPEVLRYRLNQAWDSVDNRMGQLVYDNLFWNKTVKDLGMIGVRSLGWNIGTYRELGGAVLDVPKQLGRALAGEKPELTNRIAYALALPIATAYVGAIVTYLATGEGPEDLIDYFYPPNGGRKPNGEPSRWSLPSYVRDVYGFSKSPLTTATHKIHPAVQQVYDMLQNRDFYGTEIRHPDDPLVQQAKDIAAYLVKSFEPLSFKNLSEARKELQGPGKGAASFVGLTPAPYYIGQSKAEEMASERSARSFPEGPRTKEQFERSQTIRRLRNQLSLQQITPREVFAKARAQEITPAQAKEIVMAARAAPLVREFGRLSIEDALDVYGVATTKEKDLLRRPLAAKLRNSTKSRTHEQVRELARRYWEAVKPAVKSESQRLASSVQ